MKYVNGTRKAPPTRTLKLFEMFCGVAAITRAFQNHGLIIKTKNTNKKNQNIKHIICSGWQQLGQTS